MLGLRFDSNNQKIYNMDTIRKKLLTMFAWTTGMIFVVVVVVRKHLDPFEFDTIIGDLGTAVAISGIFALAFEKWIWRIFSGRYGFPPYIEGIWKGRLKYEDVYTKEWKEKEVELEIKQCMTSANFRLHTDESDSNSICFSFVPDGIKSMHEFVYTFQNNPKPSCRDRSPIHYGTCKLDIVDGDNMNGEYWTSRTTRGELTLKRIKNGK